MSLPDFAGTFALAVPELRQLLVVGEPTERIWAAWALALKLGTPGGEELAFAAEREPEAGVRRHLLVVLAGAREVDTIKTMAVHDPDPRVRSTAIQCLARITTPDDADANALLLQALNEGWPALQVACIEALPASSAEELWRSVERLVTSGQVDVRRAAYEAAASRRPTEAARLAVQFLRHESERAGRERALRVVLASGGVAALSSLLVEPTLSTEVLTESLQLFDRLGLRFSKEMLEPLFPRLPRSEHHLLLAVLDESDIGRQRAFLLEAFVSALESSRDIWDLRQAALPRLRRALVENRGGLSRDERALYERLEAHVTRVQAEAAADPEAWELPGDPAEDAWFLSDERDILQCLSAILDGGGAG